MSEEENPNDSNAIMNLNIDQAKETNNQIEINSQTNSETSKNGNLLISLNNSENKRESYLTDRKSNISSSKSKKSNDSYYNENKRDENQFNYYKSDTQVTSNIKPKSYNNNKDMDKSNDMKEYIEPRQPIENNNAPFPEDTIVNGNNQHENEIKYLDNVRENNPSYNQTIVNILNQNNYNEKPIKRNKIKMKKRKRKKFSSCEKCLNSRFCAICCGNRGFLGFYCCLCICLWVGVGIAIAVKR